MHADKCSWASHGIHGIAPNTEPSEAAFCRVMFGLNSTAKAVMCTCTSHTDWLKRDRPSSLQIMAEAISMEDIKNAMSMQKLKPLNQLRSACTLSICAVLDWLKTMSSVVSSIVIDLNISASLSKSMDGT